MLRYCFLLGFAAVLAHPSPASAQVPERYKPTIKKGLDWLVKQQNRDGSWVSHGNQYPVAMTSFAGLALLMEGSTTGKGAYAENIRLATDWMLKRVQDNGLIADLKNPTEMTRYIFGQGYGTLFLASVYAEEENRDQRMALRDALTRAVQYTARAQSTKGGWYYTSKQDGGDNDEGATTLCQIHGLRAARAAGIPVPRATMQKAVTYLSTYTGPQGGLYYSPGSKNERPALTPGAIVAAYSPAGYNTDIVKKWIKYCQRHITVGAGPRIGHDEYTHFYFSQVLFALGETGYEKLFPNEKDTLKWSRYRQSYFDQLMRTQSQDGTWSTGTWGVGPVYTTALHLVVLQMDSEAVPALSARTE